MPKDTRESNPGLGGDLTSPVVKRLLTGDGETAAALAQGGENQQIELKERLPQARELAKELTALANSGGGVLIIGVADDGEVIGWRPADADVAVRRMREIAGSALPNLAH